MTRDTSLKNRSLRLLLVVHGYPPNAHGGTENYTNAFAREMAARGFDVKVFYPVQDATVTTPCLIIKPFENHTVMELATNQTSVYNHLEEPEIERIFQAVLKSFKPDVVHFQHTFVGLPFSLVLMAKRFGCFTCLTLHDFWYICLRTYMLPDDKTFCGGPASPEKCAQCIVGSYPAEEDQAQKALKKARVEYFITKRLELARLIFANIDLVTAPSKFVLDIHSLHISLRRSLVTPLGIEAPAVKKGGRRSGPLRFGFLGNMSVLKNVHGLVDAFAQVQGNAELHLYGKIASQTVAELLRSRLQADPRVTWHGPYAPDALGRILTDIDVGVVPSFFENYPLALREFLSAGIPVVASRVGGISEIVRDGVNGILFDPQKTEQFASILQSLVDSPRQVGELRAGIVPPKTLFQDVVDWAKIYLDGIANLSTKAEVAANLDAEVTTETSRPESCVMWQSDSSCQAAHEFSSAYNGSATPFISVCIPTFNRATMLPDAIRSVLRQDYSAFELVVVDDGSTDDTAQVVKSFDDSRVRYILKEHSGRPASRNRCLQEAWGDFVLWLDSDDVILAGTLSHYADMVCKFPDVEVFYGDLLSTDGQLHPVRRESYQDWYGRSQELRTALLLGPVLPNPGTLLRKSAFETFGGYDHNFPRAQDYEWFSRVGGNAEFKHVGRPVAKWRHHGQSRATHGGTDIYDINVVERMVARYSLDHLFPKIQAMDLPNNIRQALCYIHIMSRFIGLNAKAHALKYFKLCVAQKPPKDIIAHAAKVIEAIKI